MTSTANRSRAACAPLAWLLLFVPLLACGTTYELEVTSTPPTAKVYVNGIYQTNTPGKVTLPFDEGARVWVQIAYPGRVPGEVIYTVDTYPYDEPSHAFDLPVAR
jgi:hypothetical protein